jgi:hypothetical protein
MRAVYGEQEKRGREEKGVRELFFGRRSPLIREFSVINNTSKQNKDGKYIKINHIAAYSFLRSTVFYTIGKVGVPHALDNTEYE